MLRPKSALEASASARHSVPGKIVGMMGAAVFVVSAVHQKCVIREHALKPASLIVVGKIADPTAAVAYAAAVMQNSSVRTVCARVLPTAKEWSAGRMVAAVAVVVAKRMRHVSKGNVNASHNARVRSVVPTAAVAPAAHVPDKTPVSMVSASASRRVRAKHVVPTAAVGRAEHAVETMHVSPGAASVLPSVKEKNVVPMAAVGNVVHVRRRISAFRGSVSAYLTALGRYAVPMGVAEHAATVDWKKSAWKEPANQ